MAILFKKNSSERRKEYSLLDGQEEINLVIVDGPTEVDPETERESVDVSRHKGLLRRKWANGDYETIIEGYGETSHAPAIDAFDKIVSGVEAEKYLVNLSDYVVSGTSSSKRTASTKSSAVETKKASVVDTDKSEGASTAKGTTTG